MNTLVFDIETVPDVDLGRRLYDLDGLADAQVAKAMFALRRQHTGGDFLPLEQQRVVAIACALRSREGFSVWSLGQPQDPENELVQRFDTTAFVRSKPFAKGEALSADEEARGLPPKEPLRVGERVLTTTVDELMKFVLEKKSEKKDQDARANK